MILYKNYVNCLRVKNININYLRNTIMHKIIKQHLLKLKKYHNHNHNKNKMQIILLRINHSKYSKLNIIVHNILSNNHQQITMIVKFKIQTIKMIKVVSLKLIHQMFPLLKNALK